MELLTGVRTLNKIAVNIQVQYKVAGCNVGSALNIILNGLNVLPVLPIFFFLNVSV